MSGGKSMNKKKIIVFGDSILKGVQVDESNGRYKVDNNIDIAGLSDSFNLEIKNYSMFGCTVLHAEKLIDKYLADEQCDYVVMDLGGNDSDFDWKAIAATPDEEHLPKTPPNIFKRVYTGIINSLKNRGIKPVITSLPPLEEYRFLDWYCKGLDRKSVMRWLKTERAVYDFHEGYSKMNEEIARSENIPLVDLRKYFIAKGSRDKLLCVDGTHPNTNGQQVISQAFFDFAGKLRFSDK